MLPSARVSIVRTDDTVRVAVYDQGPGIDPGSRQQLFEKFGTVQTRRDHSYQSIGLALAFCKLAVETHGGTIGVEPAEPCGNSFWFDLPVGEHPP
jgi:two-component system sensor histidine kinase KdpD